MHPSDETLFGGRPYSIGIDRNDSHADETLTVQLVAGYEYVLARGLF